MLRSKVFTIPNSHLVEATPLSLTFPSSSTVSWAWVCTFSCFRHTWANQQNWGYMQCHLCVVENEIEYVKMRRKCSMFESIDSSSLTTPILTDSSLKLHKSHLLIITLNLWPRMHCVEGSITITLISHSLYQNDTYCALMSVAWLGWDAIRITVGNADVVSVVCHSPSNSNYSMYIVIAQPAIPHW